VFAGRCHDLRQASWEIVHETEGWDTGTDKSAIDFGSLGPNSDHLHDAVTAEQHPDGIRLIDNAKVLVLRSRSG